MAEPPRLRIAPPSLPNAVSEHDRTWMDQFSNVLRIFFNRITNLINTLDDNLWIQFPGHTKYYGTNPAGTKGWYDGPGSSSFWQYQAKTDATAGYPGNGHILWNNASQVAATSIIVAHIDNDGNDIDTILSLITNGSTMLLQDKSNSANYQKWTVSGAPTHTGGTDSYWTYPVTLVSSAGTGTTGFANNLPLVLAVATASSGGTGDVVGPGSATDKAIARFNGTTGKLIQNSASILSNTDTISTPNAAADELGFKGIPQNSQTTNYTLVLADASKCIYKGSGGAITITIPANASVAYPIGTCIEGINDDTEVLTIAITTDTLVLAPTGTTGSRSVSANGWWSIRKVAATRWFITGAGVT